MNEMLWVRKSKVTEANNELKELEDVEGYGPMSFREGFKRCLEILDLLNYDPVKEQQAVEKAYNWLHGEEDDLK